MGQRLVVQIKDNDNQITIIKECDASSCRYNMRDKCNKSTVELMAGECTDYEDK